MNIRVNRVFFDNRCEVAVIGAGPYGLAVTAHLRAANLRVRVFGETMSFWRQHMPKGMKLRSPWIATHIAHPHGNYPLNDYFGENGLPCPKLLPIENFIGYGHWFQAHVAPDLDTRAVIRVDKYDNNSFRLILDDGEDVVAKRVVVATGLHEHEYRPSTFDGLPLSLVSHSSEHTASERFRGRYVAVIGRGQSACESAALLHEAGANVEIICRGNLVWNGDPATRGALRKMVRPLLKNALIPPSQVGPFPFNWLVESPGIIRHLPEQARDRLNTHCLRATAILWLKSRLQGVAISEGRRVMNARRDGDRIALTLDNGSRQVDHVLLATGYRIDVNQMSILDPKLRARIARYDGSPVLSGSFESSVSGLHFVGASAVASFGPLLRFIAGAGFAARRVTQCILHRDRSSPATTVSYTTLPS
jgi:FAD-dependent urate hydroxylase